MLSVQLFSAAPSYDPDLREYRRSMALSALAERYSPKKLAPLATKKVNRKPITKPLFAPEVEDAADVDSDSGEENIDLIAAMQQSLEDTEETNLQRAIEESTAASFSARPTQPHASSSRSTHRIPLPHVTPRRPSQPSPPVRSESDDDDMYASPTRLETQFLIANTGPLNTRLASNSQRPDFHSPQNSLFGVPTLLMSPTQSPKRSLKTFPSPDEQVEKHSPRVRLRPLSPSPSARLVPLPQVSPVQARPASPVVVISDEEDDDLEEVIASTSEQPVPSQRSPTPILIDDSLPDSASATGLVPSAGADDSIFEYVSASHVSGRTLVSEQLAPFTPPSPPKTLLEPIPDSDSDSDAHSTRWSRSPSPTLVVSHPEETGVETTAQASTSTSTKHDEWDAAHEMDPQAEEGEYARFMSQVRGKDLDSVRKEIDDEIQSLHQQRKVAMRDSDDITQQMSSQIMVRPSFRPSSSICCTHANETDRSCSVCSESLTSPHRWKPRPNAPSSSLWVSLTASSPTTRTSSSSAGGRVFKNMFNQSKTVECFLSHDLERELGLERDKLIRLAYLLGSDYTDGLPGVGPVVAMELLTEFGGNDALHKFKDWWRRVQSGRDGEVESNSKFRKRFVS